MEYAICCYWVGKHAEAIQVNNEILDCSNLPGGHVETVIKNRKFSLDQVFPKVNHPARRKNRIKVVTPFYNPGESLEKCVASLMRQDYDNFEVIFVDDVSTDGSCEKLPKGDARVTTIQNTKRMGSLQNFHRMFWEYCEPDDIVVHVDGDDWLACDDALSYINEFYNEHDCWVMYGQFRYASGHYGISKPFSSAEAFKDLRSVW